MELINHLPFPPLFPFFPFVGFTADFANNLGAATLAFGFTAAFFGL